MLSAESRSCGADRDLDDVLQGRLSARQPVSQPARAVHRGLGAVGRKVIAEGDLCAICYEGFDGTALKHLTWCKHGCGQNVHGKCMGEWVQHQKNTSRVRSQSPPPPGAKVVFTVLRVPALQPATCSLPNRS